MSTELIWNGDIVDKLIDQAVQKSIFKTGQQTISEAAPLTPKDTSRLRGSITLQMKTKEVKNSLSGKAFPEDIIDKPIEDNVGLVGTNVKYAAWMEYGVDHTWVINSPVLIKGKWRYIKIHPGLAAQPFMRPAYNIMQGKTEGIFRNLFKTELKEYMK